jgi:hypothetical protein
MRPDHDLFAPRRRVAGGIEGHRAPAHLARLAVSPRAFLVASLALLGCGGATELPDVWTDEPELCRLDEDCANVAVPVEIENARPPDGGAP